MKPITAPRPQARRGSRANSEEALKALPADVQAVLDAKTRLDRALYARALELAPGRVLRAQQAARTSGPCYALRKGGAARPVGPLIALAPQAAAAGAGSPPGAAEARDAAVPPTGDTPEELSAWDALLEAAAETGRAGKPAPAPGRGFYGEWSNRSAPFDSWARCRRPGAGVGGGEVHVAACVASSPPLGVPIADHEARMAEWIQKCAVGPRFPLLGRLLSTERSASHLALERFG